MARIEKYNKNLSRLAQPILADKNGANILTRQRLRDQESRCRFFLVHRQRRLPVAGLVGSQSRPLHIPTRAVVSGESPANYAVCASNNSIKPSARNVRGLFAFKP